MPKPTDSQIGTTISTDGTSDQPTTNTNSSTETTNHPTSSTKQTTAKTTKWSDIPVQVQIQLKRCLLDNLGAHLAGSLAPVCQIVTNFVLDQYISPLEASILVSGHKVNIIGASLANGVMANAIDIDDGHMNWANGHPGPCLISPILAACQKFKPDCSGSEFLAALLVGYECAIRAGKIRHETYSTYHSSGSWGAIGAVAAIGNLIKMDKNTLFNALGIAEYHAPIGPMRKGIVVPSMVKDSIGWGCCVAINSILLAQHGFTGIAPIFGDTKDPYVIESLGKDFQIVNLLFKPYACCRWAQPAVTAVLKIKEKYNPNPNEIESIIIRSHRDAETLSLETAKNTEEAQYSLSHPVAAALIDGEVGPKQQTPPRMLHNDIVSLGKKVRFELDPEYDSQYMAKEFGSATVKLKNGKILESGATETLWTTTAPPTNEELQKKFLWLVNPILGEEKSKTLAETMWNFENETVKRLINLCISKQN